MDGIQLAWTPELATFPLTHRIAANTAVLAALGWQCASLRQLSRCMSVIGVLEAPLWLIQGPLADVRFLRRQSPSVGLPSQFQGHWKPHHALRLNRRDVHGHSAHRRLWQFSVNISCSVGLPTSRNSSRTRQMNLLLRSSNTKYKKRTIATAIVSCFLLVLSGCGIPRLRCPFGEQENFRSPSTGLAPRITRLKSGSKSFSMIRFSAT